MNNRYEMQISSVLDRISRQDFVHQEYKDSTNFDVPLPLGQGKTVPPPSLMGQLLMWLGLKDGDSVLVVGSGSGWPVALVSELVGKNGEVWVIEEDPALFEFGSDNCRKAGVRNSKHFLTTEESGLEQFAPFSKILALTTFDHCPAELMAQLDKNGKMVLPINDTITVVEKNDGIPSISFRDCYFGLEEIF